MLLGLMSPTNLPFGRRWLGALAAGVVLVAIAVSPSRPEARFPDRDRDGLSNAFERKRSKTNPRRKDTDRDGLRDGYEVKRSKTNPRRKDTDRDGFSDGQEVRLGSNPRNRNSVPRGSGPPHSWPWPPRVGTDCDRKAADASQLSSGFAAARPGQTICLTSSGDYGEFRAGRKGGMVVVRRGPNAEPRMSIDFTDARNVRVEGVTIDGGSITGSSRDISIRRSRFTGIFVIETGQPRANIVLDRNTHIGINFQSDAAAGRVTTQDCDDGGSSGPGSGITIRNSLFRGGDSDGVRPDCDRVRVLNNEFADIEDRGDNHADPIQFYGASRAIVRGNYFHNSGGEISAYIMQADGGRGNVIEDNVFAAGGHIYAITLYSDNGSAIRHNTFQGGSCNAGTRCGILNLGNKSGQRGGQGTAIRANVLTAISASSNGEGGGGAMYTSGDNLIARGTLRPGDVRGTPRYRGPLNTYLGFRLAVRSAGRRIAPGGRPAGIR